ncbi:hypothetical protein [Zhihengliuella flava]|uniref:Uncharacterized protein n=1 Tax=Zhihengliuella flava TaxID=1285193 RepID=A0A931D9M7_9MICC|nr:hypothetical protein [Zhihengliuella flava]MBG6084894.1 hypothetical protein [Zhihengliuella flava]
MTADHLPGHTRLSTQALSSTARIIAAEAYAVDQARIHVDLDDDYGDLALSFSLPLPATPPPAEEPAPAGGTVWDRAVGVRESIRERFVQLTGSSISRVDVRVTGIVAESPARAGRRAE